MKIGLDAAPASSAGSYSQHLAKLLPRYAPGHEYLVGRRGVREADIWHGFRPVLPWATRRAGATVVTIPDLNFLRYPHLYSMPERLFRLGMYRRALRGADRLIVFNRPMREELCRRLEIDDGRVEVVLPLAATPPQPAPGERQAAAVRRKYQLPARFVLMLGAVEPRHHYGAMLEALAETESDASLVVCGRRTSYADRLLDYARRRHLAARLEFIYELSPRDLPALFRLAQAFAYLPDARIEASIVPVVEALRAGLPMLLSDTPLNRETAADAALYVRPDAVDELAAAIGTLLDDQAWRSAIEARERRRAELFSEYAVAERLMRIYTSL